jgi:hypothetical protein
MNRREAIAALAGTGAALSLACNALPTLATRRKSVPITCVIRYQIDPFQREGFKKYAENWGRIAFDSLASHESYRARLKSDPEARDNFAMAQNLRLILREERNFVEVVDGTFGQPAKLAGRA